jgi:phage terminase small subunit
MKKIDDQIQRIKRKVNRVRSEVPDEEPELTKKKYFKLKYFIEQYMLDLDPFAAYERAGYATKDKERNKRAVIRLMAKPEIQQAIYDKQTELSERFEVNQERVIKELSLLALSNVKDLLSWDKAWITLKSSDSLSRDQTAVISEIKSSETIQGRRISCKLYDKKSALIDLGKHLGLFWEDSNKSKDPIEEARRIKEALKQMDDLTDLPEDEAVSGAD